MTADVRKTTGWIVRVKGIKSAKRYVAFTSNPVRKTGGTRYAWEMVKLSDATIIKKNDTGLSLFMLNLDNDKSRIVFLKAKIERNVVIENDL